MIAISVVIRLLATAAGRSVRRVPLVNHEISLFRRRRSGGGGKRAHSRQRSRGGGLPGREDEKRTRITFHAAQTDGR